MNKPTKTLGTVQYTERGFQYIEFKDRNDQVCNLQQSSAADYCEPGVSAIWLGLANDRMHLGCDQARALVNNLIDWLQEGRFDDE
jgi:hypothetical protein